MESATLIIAEPAGVNLDDKRFSLKRWKHAVESWQTDDDSIRLTTVDMHTAGEPLRIIVDGFPLFPSDSVLANRRLVQHRFDHLRKILMWEPRGHSDMYGCLLIPPETDAGDTADFGVLFMHNEGYSSMCGHGIIAVATAVMELGFIPVGQQVIRIDSPAGRINAWPEVQAGRVKQVRFENVPSFVLSLDQTVTTPTFGCVQYDLAFGGAFYAYVAADQLGLKLQPDHADRLIAAGREIKQSIINSSCQIRHPVHNDLSFLYGTIFVGQAREPDNHSRNVCVFADGEMDRSPTGTGVSGRAAIHLARGEIELGQEITIESILGTTFRVLAERETLLGHQRAVVATVSGSAYITGRNEFVVRGDDPLKHGFLLR